MILFRLPNGSILGILDMARLVDDDAFVTLYGTRVVQNLQFAIWHFGHDRQVKRISGDVKRFFFPANEKGC